MKHRDKEEDPSHPRRRPCPPRQRSLALPHRPSCLLKCRLQRPGRTSLLPPHQRLTPDLSSTSAALLLSLNWLSRPQHQLLSPRPGQRSVTASLERYSLTISKNVTREVKMKSRCVTNSLNKTQDAERYFAASCCGDAPGLGLGIQPLDFHDWKGPSWFARLLHGLSLDPLSPTVRSPCSSLLTQPRLRIFSTFFWAISTHPRRLPEHAAYPRHGGIVFRIVGARISIASPRHWCMQG